MSKDIEQLAHTMKLPFRMKRSAVIVLEGLDATGKTTQHERMERACMGMGTGKEPLFKPAPLFIHMPSAGTHLGQAIYDLTETVGAELDPLARQFLHLASHAQSVNTIIKPALDSGQPVVLDRWWWSTMAYGWFGGRLGRNNMSRDDFLAVASSVWWDVHPDLVAVFLHPHKEDRHNTPRVRRGYDWLVNELGGNETTVFIEPGTVGEQSEQLFDAMLSRGLYSNGG